MEQSANDAAGKDVQTKSSREVCALDTEQNSNDAAVMDVQTKL